MNSVYCKKQKQNGKTFLLKLVKMDDHLAFLILEEAAAYLGKASNNYLNETASYFSLDKDYYCSNIEKYIKETTTDIKINLTEERFSINKNVGKMNITYFSVDLEQVDFGVMAMKIATELLSLHRDASLNVIETNDKLLQAQASRDSYKEKLEKYTKEHNNNESQLYSSFCLILNEKKRQLQFYRDLLDKEQTNQISKSPTHIILSDDEISEEDNSNINEAIRTKCNENYNTDDENEAALEKSTNNGQKRIWSSSFDSDGEPLPGPSKAKNIHSDGAKWGKTRSATYNKEPVNSTTKLQSRSKSDNTFDVQNTNNFDINLDEFDLSDTDIFPSTKLPKRVKPASNLSPLVKTSAKCSQVVQTAIMQESSEVAEDSPTLNFTTQDLFDRM